MNWTGLIMWKLLRLTFMNGKFIGSFDLLILSFLTLLFKFFTFYWLFLNDQLFYHFNTRFFRCRIFLLRFTLIYQTFVTLLIRALSRLLTLIFWFFIRIDWQSSHRHSGRLYLRLYWPQTTYWASSTFLFRFRIIVYDLWWYGR